MLEYLQAKCCINTRFAASKEAKKRVFLIQVITVKWFGDRLTHYLCYEIQTDFTITAQQLNR